MSRRWHRRTERASHADDWLMTYADMITLLLCFFAVFLALSMPKKDIPPKVDPPPVEAPKPDTIEGDLPFHGLPRVAFPEDEPVDPPPVPPPPVAAPEPAPPPPIIEQPKAQVPADIVPKGDRITTMQMDSAEFFGSGSAELSNSGKSILQSVAANLKSDRFKDYRITIEGHTDDQPIRTAQFPSNWELSTSRAAAVARFLLEQGIPPQRLRAAGYADTFPVAPNRDAAGNPIPENQARNRRVVINLEKIEKTE